MKQTMRTLLVLVLVLGAMLLVPQLDAEAATVTASGYCGGEGDGTNLTWELTDDGILTIAGTGAMENYDAGKSPWYAYGESINAVTIGDDVTTIGSYAIFNCSALSVVTLDGSVTTIGESAFRQCAALTTVVLGDSITTVGDYTFYYCTSLKEVTFGESVTTIGKSAFAYCSALTAVNIPNSVTTIRNHAFGSCDALAEVTLPDGIKSINQETFSSCKSLIKVTIPDSVTTIGNYAFSNCTSLEELTLGNSVKYIGYRAFKHCSALKEVTFPDSVTTISDDAFVDCADLIAVTFGNSVETIGENAFGYCISLVEVTIPDSIKYIDDYVFYFCKSLTEVTIPSSVTSIGERAFYYCTALKEITIGDSVMSIGERAFEHCSSLTAVTFGNSVTTVGPYAFYQCAALIRLTLPDSVTTIGEYAFYDCNSLKKVILGDSVEKIGELVFKGCNALIDVTVDENNQTYYSENGVLFKGDTLLWYPAGKEQKQYTAPNRVATVGNYAFHNCRFLTEVTLPDGLQEIGYSAFNGCTALAQMIIPGTVTFINNYAFSNTALTTVTIIGGSVLSLWDYVFDNLTDIYYYGTKDQWERCIYLMGANPTLETADLHYMTTKYTTNGDNTHICTDICSDCGEVTSNIIEACVDERSDGICDSCYAELKTVNVSSMSMVLDSELLVNFNVKGLDLAADTYTAYVTGLGDSGTTYEIPEADWVAGSTSTKIPVPVAAKEMADTMTLQIKDSKGQVVNVPYEGAARDYALRGLASDAADDTLKTLLIDMLNYGAAAQVYFNYNTTSLANAGTEQYQKYATTSYEACVSKQDKGTSYGKWGAWQFMLESKIEMNVFWTGLSDEAVKDMSAKVEYVDHKGVAQTKTIPGSEFIKRDGKNDQYGVYIDFVAPADCRSLITVTAYNADGTVYAVSKDSVEGYAARVQAGSTDAVLLNMVDMMIKFIDASAAQFK